MQDLGKTRLKEIFVDGVSGRRPKVPIAPQRLAEKAKNSMSEDAWAYVAGGAGREATVRANRLIRFHPFHKTRFTGSTRFTKPHSLGSHSLGSTQSSLGPTRFTKPFFLIT